MNTGEYSRTSFLAGLYDGRQAVDSRLDLQAPESLELLAGAMGWSLDAAPVVVDDIPYDIARGMTLRAAALSPVDIPAQLHYVPVPGGIELAWRFEVRMAGGRHWYNASVSAETGELLRLVDWVDHARYHVFPLPLESPDDGDRAIVVDPHDPVASPYGWHDTNGQRGFEFTDTRGNNVFAREDWDGNDTGGASANGGATLDFDFPLNVDQSPSSYRDAAITNLFYTNNVLHDIFYQYGFDEAAGNFQRTNHTGQGQSGDQVIADAQDGLWINNPMTAYLAANTQGIRRHPYSFDMELNPITFGDFDRSNEVHDVAEIWASALWDLNWLLIDKYGFCHFLQWR